MGLLFVTQSEYKEKFQLLAKKTVLKIAKENLICNRKTALQHLETCVFELRRAAIKVSILQKGFMALKFSKPHNSCKARQWVCKVVEYNIRGSENCFGLPRKKVL